MSEQTARHGFSLIEAAIVLGIVGLVIGGIWVAASSVQKQQRMARELTGILTIVQNIQNLYVGQSPTGTTYLSGVNSLAIAAYKGADGFKADSTTPLSSHMDISVQDGCIAGAPCIWLDYYGLASTEACIQLVSKITSAARRSSLKAVYSSTLYGVGGWATTFPFFPTGAECVASNRIIFEFSVKS